MKINILFISLFCSVFAHGSFTISRNSDGSAIFFPIDPCVRGADLVAHFNQLNQDPTFKTDRSQIALQTTKNGLIPNIKELIPMTNGTVLLAKYLLPNNSVPRGSAGRDGTGASFGYAVIFVEQAVALVYSPGVIPTSSHFSSHMPEGSLPIFYVDLPPRAADLQQVVTILAKPPITNPSSTTFPVSIQTSLDGPYYTGGTAGSSLITNGLISQVKSISQANVPNGSLLIVTFKATRPNQFTDQGGFATVVVAPDQILQIHFTQN